MDLAQNGPSSQNNAASASSVNPSETLQSSNARYSRKQAEHSKPLPITPQYSIQIDKAPQAPASSLSPGSDTGTTPINSPSTKWYHWKEWPLSEIFPWLLKILGIVFALLFGIWAPLSFKATAKGNRENNSAQEKLADQLNDLTSQVRVLKNVGLQNVAGNSDAKDTLEHLAMLRVWEFCEGKNSALQACASLSASGDLDGLIQSILTPVEPGESSVIPSTTTDYRTTPADSSSTTTSALIPGDGYATPLPNDGEGGEGGGGSSNGLDVASAVAIAVAALTLVVAGFTIFLSVLKRRKRRAIDSADTEAAKNSS